MKTTPKISTLQFFLMLFLSRIVTVLSINTQTVGEGNFLDHIVSSLFVMLTLFLFMVPLHKLFKLYPEQSLLVIAEKEFGNTGKVISGVYGVYFIIINTLTLALFLTLIINTMNPSASKWSIAAVLISIALYGAVKGIETLSRASICVFTLFVLGTIVIAAALLPHFDIKYAEPILQEDSERILRGYIYFISRCSTLVEIAILVPYLRKCKYRYFTFWNVGTTAFAALLLMVVVFSLGEYAYLQLFPIYTLSTMAEIFSIQRLDALMIGLCMIALVIRLSCGLFAIGECCETGLKAKSRLYGIVISAVTIFFLSLWLTESSGKISLLFQNNYMFVFSILTSIIFPTLICIISLIKRGRRL